MQCYPFNSNHSILKHVSIGGSLTSCILCIITIFKNIPTCKYGGWGPGYFDGGLEALELHLCGVRAGAPVQHLYAADAGVLVSLQDQPDPADKLRGTHGRTRRQGRTARFKTVGIGSEIISGIDIAVISLLVVKPSASEG